MLLIFIALFLVLLVIGLFQLIVLPYNRIKSYKQEGVTTYFFPILGYLQFLDRAYKEKEDIMAYSKEYQKPDPNRKYIVTHVSRRIFFVLQKPQYVKEFLQKPQYYKKAEMIDSLRPFAKTGLAFAEGETWKRHRKTISNSFNFDFIKSKISVIQQTTQEFLDKLSPKDLENYSTISKVQEITGEIVGRIFFGENLNSYTYGGRSMTLALAETTSELSDLGSTVLFILFGQKVLDHPILPHHRRLVKQLKDLRKMCVDIVLARKANPQHKANDMLSSLLATQNSEDVEQRFSDEDIINEFITFFIAGMDTTGHLIGMALYNLTQYPEYLKSLQAEREKTYNKDSSITTDTLHKMDLLHAFLKETLRFYPPGPMPFLREAVQDHDLLDLKIKKGELIASDFLSPAFDETYLENPMQFQPERWMNQDSKADPYAFVPFSAGPRNCIGQHLAMMEAKVIISEFLNRFAFALKEGYKLKMTIKFLYEPADELLLELRSKSK